MKLLAFDVAAAHLGLQFVSNDTSVNMKLSIINVSDDCYEL